MRKFDRLIVCGDSFNSYSHRAEYKGTHWSEILRKKLNVPLLNFASPGCSNKLITVQMLEALKYPGSLVIAAPSSHYHRFEILLDKTKSLENNISLKNFEIYNDCKQDQKPFLKSINANFLSCETFITPQQANTLLDYLPLGFNRYTDKWALFYALYQLKQNKFNFLFFELDIWNTNDVLFNDLKELEQLVGPEHIVYPKQHQFYTYYIDKIKNKLFDDPGYHTMPDSQIKISDMFYNEIIERGFING